MSIPVSDSLLLEIRKECLRTIGLIVLIFSLVTLFAWVSLSTFTGFLKMFEIYTAVNEKEMIDFTWQVILFNFVVSGLLLNMKKEGYGYYERKFLSTLPFFFICAGVLLIAGFGGYATGHDLKQVFYLVTGKILFNGSLASMSLGVTALLFLSVKWIISALLSRND